MIEFHLVKRIDSFVLDVEAKLDAHCTVIYGRNGSGKTLLLNLLAGLVEPDGGYVKLASDVLYGGDGRSGLRTPKGVERPSTRKSHQVPTHKRGISFIFQDNIGFPHLTVEGNLRFVAKGISPSEIDRLLSLVGLTEKRRFYPDRLSFGQRQLLNLARAIASRPRLILMDEPFASLDNIAREEMVNFLQGARGEIGIPIVYVTHSLGEVEKLADHLLILDNGKVLEQGRAALLLQRPRRKGSAEILGYRNIIEVICELRDGIPVLVTPLGTAFPGVKWEDRPRWVAIHPRDIRVSAEDTREEDESLISMSGVVTDIRQGVRDLEMVVELSSHERLTVEGRADGRRVSAGDRVELQIPLSAIIPLV